jgi:nucleoside-diphosphate-sugar epimerase
MRLLIVGAAGFIGSYLTRRAARDGHEVVALCRSGKVSGFVGEISRWKFGEPIPEKHLNNLECALHLAHDFNGVQGARLTLSATVSNVKQLQSAGVSRQIFFSSCSAGPHARSLYGKTKLAIERDLAVYPGVIIIRPGLVLGEGGIYGRIKRFVNISPVIPLPDGGYHKVPIISIERLYRETLLCALGDTVEKERNVFEKNPVSLRGLVQDIALKEGKRPLLVNVPSIIISAGLCVADFLRLPLPVNSDNLRGLLANQDARHISSLEHFDTSTL